MWIKEEGVYAVNKSRRKHFSRHEWYIPRQFNWELLLIWLQPLLIEIIYEDKISSAKWNIRKWSHALLWLSTYIVIMPGYTNQNCRRCAKSKKSIFSTRHLIHSIWMVSLKVYLRLLKKNHWQCLLMTNSKTYKKMIWD